MQAVRRNRNQDLNAICKDQKQDASKYCVPLLCVLIEFSSDRLVCKFKLGISLCQRTSHSLFMAEEIEVWKISSLTSSKSQTNNHTY